MNTKSEAYNSIRQNIIIRERNIKVIKQSIEELGLKAKSLVRLLNEEDEKLKRLMSELLFI